MMILATKKPEPKPPKIQRIVVAITKTRTAEAAARYAARIAKSCRASLYVTYIFWPNYRHGYGIDQEQIELRHELEHLTDRVRGMVAKCKSAFLVGEPAQRVSKLARDIHADLIVTTDCDLTLRSWLLDLGDETDIVHLAPCSVVIFPTEAD